MNLFQRGRPTQDAPCVIVASNGRSGSTLMFEALWMAEAQKQWGPWKRKITAVFEQELATAYLEPGSFVKTHDFPDALKTRKNVKVLFCFGSTKDSALSVYSAMERFGPEWVEQHFNHLHADGTFEDLFRYDVLNQAKQMKQWATFTDVPVLCLNYDAIWRRQGDVADFLGMEFDLPARANRAPKAIPEDILTQASAVYDPIDVIIDELPELFVASPEYAGIVNRLPSMPTAA